MIRSMTLASAAIRKTIDAFAQAADRGRLGGACVGDQ